MGGEPLPYRHPVYELESASAASHTGGKAAPGIHGRPHPLVAHPRPQRRRMVAAQHRPGAGQLHRARAVIHRAKAASDRAAQQAVSGVFIAVNSGGDLVRALRPIGEHIGDPEFGDGCGDLDTADAFAEIQHRDLRRHQKVGELFESASQSERGQHYGQWRRRHPCRLAIQADSQSRFLASPREGNTQVPPRAVRRMHCRASARRHCESCSLKRRFGPTRPTESLR